MTTNRRPHRRAALLLALLTVATSAALAGGLLQTRDRTPDPVPLRSSPAHATAVTVREHAQEWAQLIYEAQRLQGLLTTHRQRVPAPTAGTTALPPARAATAVGFHSPIATLAQITLTGSRLRYCLTAADGEFHAVTVTGRHGNNPEQTSVLGLGECDYTDGYLIFTADRQPPQALAAMVEEQYRVVAEHGLLESGNVTRAFDGTNRALVKAVLATGWRLADYARKHELPPLALDPATRRRLGLVYPDPIRFGYYDNRGQVGYRVCLTDGTEEAVYEDTIARAELIRHSTGTCGG